MMMWFGYVYLHVCLLVFERNGGKVARVSCSCDSINLVLGMYLYLFLTVCTRREHFVEGSLLLHKHLGGVLGLGVIMRLARDY